MFAKGRCEDLYFNRERYASGTSELNIEKGEALIDYSIASEYRGRGLGYVIIELISEKVRCMKNVNSLVAHVKAANVLLSVFF